MVWGNIIDIIKGEFYKILCIVEISDYVDNTEIKYEGEYKEMFVLLLDW